MAEIVRIDRQRANDEPEAEFANPQDVIDHILLTRGQKLAALEKWAFSVRARIDAVNEGMNNGPGGAYTADVELLQRLEVVMEQLRTTK